MEPTVLVFPLLNSLFGQSDLPLKQKRVAKYSFISITTRRLMPSTMLFAFANCWDHMLYPQPDTLLAHEGSFEILVPVRSVCFLIVLRYVPYNCVNRSIVSHML